MLTQIRSSKVYGRVTKHAIVGEFVRYALIGALNVTCFFALFNGLLAVNMPTVPAYILAFVTTSIGSFFLNKRWAFKDASTDGTFNQYARFLVITAIGLGLSFVVVKIALIRLESHGPLGKNIAAACGLPVSILWNFFSYRRWTFNRAPAT